jgi:hypothetical protein
MLTAFHARASRWELKSPGNFLCRIDDIGPEHFRGERDSRSNPFKG